MNILYVGDVMARPGVVAIERWLPVLRREHAVDLVVAQAENVAADGKGITPADFARLKAAGVDFCTGGNHTLSNDAVLPLLSDKSQPIIRPANYPAGTPGLGYKYVSTVKGDVLVISLQGKIVGKDTDVVMDNPLKVIDTILEQERLTRKVATVVNFHGDYSSEKVIIGHYLDGRVSLVVGDHWHVQTADARVLPKGTAHMTDVGMCGSLDSSLGVQFDSLVKRWRDDIRTRNVIETDGPMQLCALLVDVNERTGLARSAEAIRIVF